MKMTKSAFLGQNSGGGHGGDKPIFQVVGGIPPSPPPLRETLPSAMNSYLLKDVLIETIATFSNVENSAHSGINSEIQRLVPEQNNDFQKNLPNYVKLGKLERLDIENKEIIIAVQNSPAGICDDDVSYNNKAARPLSELYGFQYPSYQCSAHICDGTVKRLARSKTMSAVEIKECYESLSPTVKNFSCSMKNKESLDQAMKMLQMTPFHLFSWCAMCNLYATHLCHAVLTSKSESCLP